jgi:protein-S-isoprenylcysteine O-methyltransferase Ste14
MSDRGSERQLSPRSAAVAWAAYVVHAAVVVLAARRSCRSFPAGKRAAGAAGLSLVTMGAAMFGAGAARFRSFEQLSGLESGRLVTGGIYRYGRDPQNIGWGLALTGVALAGRFFAVLSLVAPFWPLFRFYLVLKEEPYLKKTFGREYEKYRSKATRYLGTPKR